MAERTSGSCMMALSNSGGIPPNPPAPGAPPPGKLNLGACPPAGLFLLSYYSLLELLLLLLFDVPCGAFVRLSAFVWH